MRLLLRSATRLQGASVAQSLVQTVQFLQRPTLCTLRTNSPEHSNRSSATMATAQEVEAALQELLPTLDPNTATERKIREQVADKLGDISEHKKLIKGIIDDYLTEQLKQSSQPQVHPKRQRSSTPVSDEDDDEENDNKPTKQRKSHTAGNSSSGSYEGAPAGGIMLDTQGLKWVSVSNFKGQQYVNLRNYYRVKETGALGPTKKGISLNPTLWSALQAALPQLQQALIDEDEDCSVQLNNQVKATISTYQGKLQVDIREYYEADGEAKPSQKGISLQPPQFDSLVEAVATINKQLGSSSSQPSALAAPAAAAAGGEAAAGPSARKQAAAAAGGAGKGSSSSAGGSVDLGGRKRAAVSDFGGGGVDLREMYEKDGQLLPGKKGILLRPTQWSAVCDAADDITKALEMRNMKYKLDLGNKRSVQLSEFRNQYYVAIREYYEKDGKLLPGAKGCNLTGDQWYKLVDGMAQLNEELK